LLIFYLAWSLPFAVIGSGKAGSAFNYLLEFVLLIAPALAACAVAGAVGTINSREMVVLVLLSLLSMQIPRLGVNLSPTAEDARHDAALQAFLRRNLPPGTRGFDFYSGDLLRAGLAVPISDPFQYTLLACHGILPEDEFVGALRGR